jgi:hypothetical protein
MTETADLNLQDITSELQTKPKNEFQVKYLRGLIHGKDKVIIRLCLNDSILAQAVGDPDEIIEHLEATVQQIKHPTYDQRGEDQTTERVHHSDSRQN